MGIFNKIKNRHDQKLDRYLDGYENTRKGIGATLGALFHSFKGVSDDFLEDMTKILLQADVGPSTTIKIVDSLRNENKHEQIVSVEVMKEKMIDELENIYQPESIKPIHYCLNAPTVILIVGVNGVGKTTTIAKLVKYYQDQNKTVAVAAGDTFRAGAREQLQLWANRLNVPCIAGKEKADPASVIVDACHYVKEHKIDILLCDTAGRLQNKNNLMQELEKITRVINKTLPGQPYESWLVIDANSGQNGLGQAESFQKIAKVTGIILTKMDGNGKGGIVLAIRDKLGLPVRFVGTGEKVEDFAPFDYESYFNSLLRGIDDESA